MATNRVLIPLDGSDFSRQILPYAHRFLNPADSELIVLRVGPAPKGIAGVAERPAAASTTLSYGEPMFDPSPNAELAGRLIYETQGGESTRFAIENKLRGDTRWLEDAGYIISVRVRFGDDPAEEIIDFAENEAVDLVAMTTHGRTGLSRMLFGSIAEEVVRSVSVPVLLLRPTEQQIEPRHAA